MQDVITRLTQALGPNGILTGPDLAPYETDWTGAYSGKALIGVRPATTEEVSAVMRIAHETATPVVPRSGGTGLAAGALPDDTGNAILLSLDRLSTIHEINPDARTATVGAGVILDTLHRAAEQHGLIFPLIFGARGSCMIGGNLATNAGGSNGVRYGNTRDLCLGLEVVLPDGEVMNLLSGLRKNNTGYDLRHLFIGSEGTLGVITAATLKLFPKPRAYATAMVSARDLPAALAMLNRLNTETGGAVEAFEYMPADYFDLALQRFPQMRAPFDHPAETGLLIEVAATSEVDATPATNGNVPVITKLETILTQAMEDGLLLDAVIAQSEAQRQEMWQRRECALEVVMSGGRMINADIALPLDHVAPFLDRMNTQLPRIAPGARANAVAHLGDGNIHYVVWPVPGSHDPLPPGTYDRIMEAIEDIALEMGGSFSAEHGIGSLKNNSMARRKDPVALRTMAAIKKAIDPKNIMNPGKLLPSDALD